MKRKILIKRIALSMVLLIVLALAVVYIWSTIILDKTYPVPLTEVHIPNDTLSVREGARLVQIEHCGDCHGDHLTGAVFRDMDPHIATLVAPNLTQVIPAYSNEEIERVLRYGVKKNGHSVYEMPVSMYHQLKEESVVNIIAYLRSMPPLPTPPGVPAQSSFTFSGRLKLIKGRMWPEASRIKPNSPRLYIPHDTTQVSMGKYLVMTTCTACHGKDLKGFSGFSPDLIIAAAYKKEEFFKLLRNGVALGDRKDIGMMSQVAKDYLSYFNDKEVSSIYAYLKTKPTDESNQVPKK
jgi:mono/diheme cytochrome c family protein